MRLKKGISSFTPTEVRRFILPVTIASISILAVAIVECLIAGRPAHSYLVLVGSLVIVHMLLTNAWIARIFQLHTTYGLLNAVASGVGLGLLAHLLPARLAEASHLLIVFGALAVAILSGRVHAYVALLLALVISLALQRPDLSTLAAIVHFSSPFVISVVVSEALLRIINATRTQIHRLETINIVSRKIMLSLEPEQTLSLIDSAIQDALPADFHFLGTVRGEDIHLDLLYDGGRYFNGTRVPLRGTLSGWVIQNQKELFLPDLRKAGPLEGVDSFMGTGERKSLSWMGVPLAATHITGVIALGSYAPNAFDQGDMELLANLAQHVSLALDNAVHHAQVEEQVHLDSLTGVLNHGSFLETLAAQARSAQVSGTPLGLIMLDIDYFKRYNDTFGHLTGDRILTELCTIIRQHIKHGDAVGRWGGEEFVVSLPGATGHQALQVAERISDTLSLLEVRDRDGNPVPIPTVSQGIAVFPGEADEIFRLIDLADRRLYIAKQRGRNQIEPSKGSPDDKQD